MRKWRVFAAVMFSAMVVGLTACNPFGGGGGVGQWQAQVKRGDIAITVSGSGNVQVANEVKLAFGTGGKVAKIHVKEGDTVKKGSPLAQLETDALELSLSQTELNQAQADLAVSQAELGEMQTTVALSQAEVALSQAEVARSQAEVAVEAAKFDLDRMKDVQEIKDDIEEAEWELKIAEMEMKEAVESKSADGDVGYWVKTVLGARERVLELQEDLAELLGKDEYTSLQVDEVKIKALKVQAAEDALTQARKNVEQAEKNLEQAKKNLEQAKKNTEYARKSLDFTRQAVKQARKQLTEATITAPFDGLVAAVNADEGDIIPTPTVSPKTVIHLIDPSSMELEVEVDEIDIPKVKLNQKATINLDAFPDAHYEGRVTSISSLPSPQAGVILYKVKIGFQATPDAGIKVNMSADANIVLQERKGVLLVPSRAISRDSAGNSVVNVAVERRIEQRAVTLGVSDGFDTEIISGLNEGETVVVESKPKQGGGLLFQ